MPRNGSGGYTLPLSDVVANTTILASWANATLTDVAAALTASLAKDGQTQPTANLPMNGYRHTGVGNPTARDQYATVAGIQNSSYIWCGTLGGTANAITATPSPAITAYAAGQIFAGLSTALNNNPATLNVSGLGAKNIYSASGAAMYAGDIPAAGALVMFMYAGTQFILLNPAVPYASNPQMLFSGYLTATQTIPDNTLTVLSGFTEEQDTGARFGVSYYVAPYTGWYDIRWSASLQTDLGNVTELFTSMITDDTASTVYGRGSMVCPAAIGGNRVCGSAGSMIKKFTALDRISLSVFHNTGVSRDAYVSGNAHNRLQINWVGP